MTSVQHFLKNLVGIAAAVVSAFGVVVIDPRKNDDSGLCVIPKKQPVPLKKFCPKPVPMHIAQHIALPIVGQSRIGGNDFKGQLADGRQTFGCVFFDVAGRVFLPQYFNLAD